MSIRNDLLEALDENKRLKAQNKALFDNHLGALAIKFITEKSLSEEWALWIVKDQSHE